MPVLREAVGVCFVGEAFCAFRGMSAVWKLVLVFGPCSPEGVLGGVWLVFVLRGSALV